jgi:predicted N-acetyltransferase YhbS
MIKMQITVRPLKKSDLPKASHINRLAFGTLFGETDLESFWIDVEVARTRWLADPASAFGAEVDGELVGSNFASRWGSVGLLGPLSVHPDLWDQGIGKRLMEPVMKCIETWRVTHAGLFALADSPKHLGLYQKYGFWPRFLTAIMSKPVQRIDHISPYSNFSQVTESEQRQCLNACRVLTNDLYLKLDLEREILAVHTQGLGDTVLLRDGQDLMGFAVCHCGPGTEAGNNKCYIKFGSVRQGPEAEEYFDQLLDACEELAVAQGMSTLEAGINTARHEAYRKLIDRGFRSELQGVTMHHPNEPAYDRPDMYIIDDWR